MTVSSSTARVSHSGDGSSVTFAVTFYFLSSFHLKVIKRSAAGVETTLTLTTDYTVSGAGSMSGGSVTLVSAPALGETVVILRNVPLTQDTDYLSNDSFPASSHEAALDKLTMEVQQLQEQLDRSVKVAASDTTTPDQLLSSINASVATCTSSATSANAAWTAFRGQYYGSASSDPALDPNGAAIGSGDLYFNTSTGRLRVYNGVAWADVGVQTPVSVSTQSFSGNASTTAFTLTATPLFQAAVEVFISGVAQVPGVDFTVSGAVVTFTAAPPAGTNNIFTRVLSTFSIGVANDASITPAKMANSGYEFGSRNRVINGGMTVSQRYGTTLVTNAAGYTGLYTLDRWAYQASQASKFTIRQYDYAQGDVAPPPGFSSYLRAESLGLYTAAAGEFFVLHQCIEGINWADLDWGAATAKPVTISFWVYASTGGLWSGALTNRTGSRSYPFSFSLGAASWTQVTVTVTGDTGGSGVWPSYAYPQNLTDIGVFLRFDLGSGANYKGTAGSWASANYNGAAGGMSLLNVNRKLYLTGVQVERGLQATPFETRPYGTELALCQRYSYTDNSAGVNGAALAVGLSVSATLTSCGIRLPVPMRATPSAIVSAVGDFNVTNGSGTLINGTAAGFFGLSPVGGELQISVASGLTAGQATLLRTASANARIHFSAEL